MNEASAPNPMTLQELLLWTDSHPGFAIAWFLTLPLLALLMGRFHTRTGLANSPLRWCYATVLFGVCVPGILASVALADTIYHGGLLATGLFSELLPILSMSVTLGLINHQTDPDQIPGFQRLTGFIILLLLTTISVWLLKQTRIWIFITGGIWTLLISLCILFLLLKWAFNRAFGSSR